MVDFPYFDGAGLYRRVGETQEVFDAGKQGQGLHLGGLEAEVGASRIDDTQPAGTPSRKRLDLAVAAVAQHQVDRAGRNKTGALPIFPVRGNFAQAFPID